MKTIDDILLMPKIVSVVSFLPGNVAPLEENIVVCQPITDNEKTIYN